jgi:hypothetical protein
MLEWQIGGIVPSIKGREVTLCEVRASMTQASSASHRHTIWAEAGRGELGSNLEANFIKRMTAFM